MLKSSLQNRCGDEAGSVLSSILLCWLWKVCEHWFVCIICVNLLQNNVNLIVSMWFILLVASQVMNKFLTVYNRSAYILFVRDRMKKLSKSSDFNSNKENMRECAKSWSKLSDAEKKQFRNLLDREWQQYERDVQEFKKVSRNFVCVCYFSFSGDL